jgi:chromate reductase
MNIVAICGSLRPNSSNYALIEAIRDCVPVKTNWKTFEIKQLPFFDPQLQFDPNLPSIVSTFRALVQKSDYILISTPEYAHGIPGILKNALEWIICEETMEKKVAVVIGSPGNGEFVKEYLLETLNAMDLVTNEKLTLTVKIVRSQIGLDGKITDIALRNAIENFAKNFLN